MKTMAMQLRFFLSMGILLFSGCVKNVAEDPEQDCSEQEAFYVENIAPLMSQSCLVCHSGPSPAGNPPLSLDSFNSVLNSMASTLDRVNRDQGSAGFMPQGGGQLSEDQLASLQTFFEMDCE